MVAPSPYGSSLVGSHPRSPGPVSPDPRAPTNKTSAQSVDAVEVLAATAGFVNAPRADDAPAAKIDPAEEGDIPVELAEPKKLGVLPAVDPELASSRPVTETAGIVRPTAAIQQTTSIVSRKRLPSLRLGSKLRCLVSPPGERTSRLIAPPKRC